MIEATLTVKALTTSELAAAFAAMPNPKYKFIVALQAYVGLRISEVLTLRIKDFNFQKKTLFVKELKHRKDKAKLIEKPFPEKILEYAVNYYKDLKSKNPDDYMFPAATIANNTYLSRKQAWRYIKTHTGWHPHCFRHTFVTMLVDSGLPVHEVQKMVGHSRMDTTMIYYTMREERKRKNVEALIKTSLFERLKNRVFPKESDVHLLPVAWSDTNIYVGRKDEIKKILELKAKNVNTLVLAERGMGKTTLLKNFKGDNILEVHDFDGFRKTLANMLLHLNKGSKEELLQLMNGDVNVITKGSPKHIAEWLCKITQKYEFTIIIDDATRVTNSIIPALEILTKHFHMIVGARSIPISQSSWLSNFEKVQLNPLNRPESRELIQMLSREMNVKTEDVELYTNHIYESSAGNPLAIREMIQRFSAEKFVGVEDIQMIRHSSGKKRRSFVPFLLVFIACIAISKFLIKEESPEDTVAGQMIAGAIMIILMLSRFGLNSIKRKFV